MPNPPVNGPPGSRPIPEAADAVAEAANAVRADAETLGSMLAEIRAGWLWKLLTMRSLSIDTTPKVP
jgi:hypothetical protein